ncbi:MAG: restriction endonuclease subunit S [Bacteroidota bacterium]
MMAEQNYNELPERWIWTTLKEIIKVRNGYAFSSSDYRENGVLLVRQTNLSGDRVVLDNAIFLPKDYLSKYQEYEITKGDILVGMSGSIGKICVYEYDEPALQNQRTGLLQFYESSTKHYVRYYFLILSSHFEKLAKGVAVQNISAKEIESVELPLPPLPEQQRIVAKIEELFTDLDAGVAALKQIQVQLKRYRQSVLKTAFEGKLTADWKKHQGDGKRETGAELLERIREERKKRLGSKYKEPTPIDTSELPELPEGWVWARISDICDVVRGGSPRPAGDSRYYNGTIPFLKVADLTKDNNIYLNSFEFTIKEAGLRKTRQIHPNTLLLTNSGATLGVPKICMIEATMNDGIAALLNLDDCSNLYIYYFWQTKTKELRNINQGAAQPNLNTTLIKDVIFPITSFEEQERIAMDIDRYFSVADAIEKTVEESLAQSERLRQSILKKAFEGKLVPQDPTDEPAEKLLERIKAEREKCNQKGKRKTIKGNID